MALITLSRKHVVGKVAPPSASGGKGGGAADLGAGHLFLNCPYLLLTSVLYMAQTNTKITTAPTAKKGWALPSYFNQTHIW